MDGKIVNNTLPYRITNARAPPYLPPAMLDKRLKWSVFLSFRGEDTRHNFTTHLRDALTSKGLKPFMDDEGMDRGDEVQPSLDEAIEDSALVVAIISPRYADSRWCLKELCRIFECRKRVIPVFYQVDPSDVREQQGLFGEGLQKLLNDDSKGVKEADSERWRNALKKAGNISGFAFRCERCMEFWPENKQCGDVTCPMSDSDKSEALRRIVQQVWNELRNAPEYAMKFEVGLHSRVDEVTRILNVHSNVVRFVGIHGTSGIGKTTLANAVFNKLVGSFEKGCFISNVNEKLATESGLLSVQNQLIKDFTSGEEPLVKQVDDGKTAIKGIVQKNKVLLVLDDVIEVEKLKTIGIIREWFTNESRIIVTTSNVNVFDAHNDEVYEAKKLNKSEALELFCIHALGRRKPTQVLQELSKNIVSQMDGLPLALEVLGSFLANRTKKEWEDALVKLGDNQRSNLQQVLQLSYDGLDEQEKLVFLDISCLLLQMKIKREDAVDILAACDLRAELAIGNLVMRSLLKITEDEVLWMHDQIRDIGRNIVEKECSHDTANRSRLWDSKEIKHALSQEKVTVAVRGIVLGMEKPPESTNVSTFTKYLTQKFKNFTSQHGPEQNDDFILNAKWFEKMVHLKLLQIDHAKLQGDFKYMPFELRWLQWRGCPQKSLPINIPQELRVLDLSRSNIEHLWNPHCLYLGFNKVGPGNLMVINLSYCPKIAALPDMSRHRHLKKLILEHCVGLESLHESIGSLSSLVHLNLRGCTNLVDFPGDVTGMKSLEELILSECSKFRELPENVRSMKSLIQLYLDRTSITKLPKYVFHLTKLQVLNLNSCCQMERLPDCVGSLSSLRELSLSHTKLVELPDTLGLLTNLEKLSLIQCSSLTALPDSLGKLKSLTELHLNGSSIKQLSGPICSLSYLKVFT